MAELAELCRLQALEQTVLGLIWTCEQRQVLEGVIYLTQWQVFTLYTPDCGDSYRQKWMAKQTKSTCKQFSKGVCYLKLYTCEH